MASERSGAEDRPKRAAGRPHNRWLIRVLRIEAGKYPQFALDKDHPFARMSVDARLEEIDSFLACLQVRRHQKPTSGGLAAAA